MNQSARFLEYRESRKLGVIVLLILVMFTYSYRLFVDNRNERDPRTHNFTISEEIRIVNGKFFVFLMLVASALVAYGMQSLTLFIGFIFITMLKSPRITTPTEVELTEYADCDIMKKTYTHALFTTLGIMFIYLSIKNIKDTSNLLKWSMISLAATMIGIIIYFIATSAESKSAYTGNEAQTAQLYLKYEQAMNVFAITEVQFFLTVLYVIFNVT